MVLPKLPRNKLENLDAAHADAVDMFHKFIDEPLTATLCKRLAHNLHFALKNSPNPDRIFQTLMQYENKVLTNKWCNLLARQLIARKDELDIGVLHLFDTPTRDEWVALEAYSVEHCPWRNGQAGVQVTFYCLTGHPAGHLLKKKFPEPWMAWLAYQIGYSRKLPYDYDVERFVGLRFWGYLTTSDRNPLELDFEDWRVDPKMKRSNLAILRRRMRFEVDLDSVRENTIGQYSCPFDKDIYCSECRCTIWECNASYNRERVYVGRPVLDREPSGHREP